MFYFSIMGNILIISGHDNIQISVANKTILENLKDKLDNAEFDYLSDYGFNLNVKKEQEKLLNADVIVFQFPVYWYNCPAVLRNWFEKVFERGFAYGSTGDKLKGKKVLFSCTLASAKDAYTKNGAQRFEVEELMENDFKAICNLCQLKYCGLMYHCGCMFFSEEEKEKVRQSSTEYSKKLIDKIKSL